MASAPGQQKLAALSPAPRGEAAELSVEWYAVGQTTIVEIAGVRLAIRLVDRKGRRARIAVTATSAVARDDTRTESRRSM